jgi:alpha-galactosidase
VGSCGDHPLWGGRFYALDSEHPEVRRYLEEVFRTFIVDWGFRFIKADFLYATARVPAGGMTRAERAARAHQFLYDLCLRYGAQLLSCGATLPSAYGRTDYARIGADVSETWENATEGRTPSREKVSTRASLTNTVTRAPLNGVMFGNDPDVIIIRSDRQLLWRRERWTLAEVNSCLGSLVFSSDHPSWYGRWQRQVVRQLKHRFGNGPWRVSSVESLRIDDTGIAARIRFSGRSEKLSVNLSDHKAGALLPHKSVIHE